MKKIDRFILRDILSDGPAGTVYKAEEILPGDNRRTVVLKLLPAIEGVITGDTPAEQRFYGEVKVLAQLAVHPNVVTIYAMGLTDGFPWLAMEYAPNTLTRFLTDRPALTADVQRLLEQLADGLSAMHGLTPPLLHQDLKPANILVDANGNYKITDFSLASVVGVDRTFGLATVRYAAPEMLSSVHGRISPATDLYALGHIAYEFALGTRLHRQQFPAVFEGNPSKDPPPQRWMSWHDSRDTRLTPVHELRRDFPSDLSEVISRLVNKPQSERYSSAADLRRDLAILRNEVATHPGPTSSSPPIASPQAAPSSLAKQTDIPFARPPSPPDSPPTSPPIPPPIPPTGPPNPSRVDQSQYWIRLRGKVTGPFSLSNLQRQVKQGQVSRFHQVSTDQLTWKSAAEVEGLYGPTVV